MRRLLLIKVVWINKKEKEDGLIIRLIMKETRLDNQHFGITSLQSTLPLFGTLNISLLWNIASYNLSNFVMKNINFGGLGAFHSHTLRTLFFFLSYDFVTKIECVQNRRE